jgi:hypothetical protein
MTDEQSNFTWLDTLMRATEDDLNLTLTRINDAADLTEATAARLKVPVYSALAKLMDARSALRVPPPGNGLELLVALRMALDEINEHNREYRHTTDPGRIGQIETAIANATKAVADSTSAADSRAAQFLRGRTL